MRVTFSKNDRDGLLNCCGRKPYVHVVIDSEAKLRRQFYLVCPICSCKVSGDTFSSAKFYWNLSVDFDNDFMEFGV